MIKSVKVKFPFKKVKSARVGLPPGSAVYTGSQKDRDVIIERHIYDKDNYELEKISADQITFAPEGKIQWININGVHDIDLINQIAKVFTIHSLSVEDILETKSRPKIEFHDNYIFSSFKANQFVTENEVFHSEHVSLLLFENTVITFQEKEEEVFNYLKKRVKQSIGRVRKMGADYLYYALIDSIIDNYFLVLDSMQIRLQNLEEKVLNQENDDIIKKTYELKKEVLSLRRSIAPIREIINNLTREEHPLITDRLKVFLRDVADNTLQIHDSIESLRDIASSVIDLHLSTMSNKMNEIMKYLTVFASIFIPLTFIAGIYGMNFEYMPELKWRYGYPVLMCAFVVIGVGLFILFKRRKWI